MTEAEFQLLIDPKVTDFVEKNLNKNVTMLALSRKGNGQFPPLVYAQIKNLQKSEKKIPSFFRARAILPTRALEQCSSEATASLKDISGDTFLDLCCGLGVDSAYLSTKFRAGTALEADEILAKITTYNYEKQGISHVKVKHQTAEGFLQNYTGEPFDLIYADPDRRDERGERQFLLEKIQPNIPELMPLIRQHSKRLLVKLSPLFDLAEAERYFSHDLHRIVVVSVDNECKELWVDCIFASAKQPHTIHIKTLRKGTLSEYSFTPEGEHPRFIFEGDWENYQISFPETKYIWEPDVAFYKARKTIELIGQIPGIQGHFNHQEGYFFSHQPPPETFPGRAFKVIRAMPFQAKKIKKIIGKEPIQLSKRYTDQSTQSLRKRLGVRDGGSRFLLCTNWGKRLYAYLAEAER